MHSGRNRSTRISFAEGVSNGPGAAHNVLGSGRGLCGTAESHWHHPIESLRPEGLRWRFWRAGRMRWTEIEGRGPSRWMGRRCGSKSGDPREPFPKHLCSQGSDDKRTVVTGAIEDPASFAPVHPGEAGKEDNGTVNQCRMPGHVDPVRIDFLHKVLRMQCERRYAP